jgi:hypothetical protein
LDRNDLAYQMIDPFSATRFLRDRNQQFTAPGTSELNLTTQLSEPDEAAFRQWVAANNVPFHPDRTVGQDYDMRGFWQGLQRGDPRAKTGIDPNDQRLHFTDTWKTPYHESFSGESKFAVPGAPSWNDQDQLVAPGGRVMFDDRQGR